MREPDASSAASAEGKMHVLELSNIILLAAISLY